MKDEFPDLYGNYYSELSDRAKNRFGRNQLFIYCEMDEKALDKDVITQFLKLNFCGVPQSESHIEYVRSLRVK